MSDGHNYHFGPPAGGWDAWKERAAAKAAEDAKLIDARLDEALRLSFYVGGPMRGWPMFNFPAFDSLAAWLRAEGWAVANPADHDREVLGRDVLESADGYAEGDITTWAKSTGFSFSDAMRWDLEQVLRADAIVLLPGWQSSTGARYERIVAEAAGRKVYLAKRVGRSLWSVRLDSEQKRMRVTCG